MIRETHASGREEEVATVLTTIMIITSSKMLENNYLLIFVYMWIQTRTSLFYDSLETLLDILVEKRIFPVVSLIRFYKLLDFAL